MKHTIPTQRVTWLVAASACLAFLGCSLSATAAETNVTIYSSIYGGYFSPPNVSISVNDSVKWTWAGNFHSTTSDTAIWDSNVQNVPYTFTWVFNSSGNF